MGTYGKPDSVDYDQLIIDAKTVDTLPPHCFPLDITVDAKQLQTSFVELIKRLGFGYDEFMEQEAARSLRLQRTVMEADAAIAWDINLNHLPHLTGADRWGKHRGQFEHIFAEGVTPADYTKLLDELDGLYIKSVIESVYAHHKQKYNREFRGKSGIIWIGPRQGYNFHWDAPRTPIRYHVPIFTNERALWLFKDNDSADIFKMHMPVGTVWEFYPVSIEHTVINQGDSIRAHMIITEVN